MEEKKRRYALSSLFSRSRGKPSNGKMETMKSRTTIPLRKNQRERVRQAAISSIPSFDRWFIIVPIRRTRNRSSCENWRPMGVKTVKILSNLVHLASPSISFHSFSLSTSPRSPMRHSVFPLFARSTISPLCFYPQSINSSLVTASDSR